MTTHASAVMEAVRCWRQGDFLLGDLEFLSVNQHGEAEFRDCCGWLVTSQTCDIVRDVAQREFVEVSALVATNAATWNEVIKGLRPQYATVRALESHTLVADLDRIMTISKLYLASSSRSSGCRDDDERRALSHALARKRSRPAFPDDFVDVVRKLQTHVRKKHDKASAEGDALRALREIRVLATPDWSADSVAVTIYLLWETQEELERDEALAIPWEEKLSAERGRFTIDFVPTVLERLSARAYVDSDPLDLDHLTIGQPSRAA